MARLIPNSTDAERFVGCSFAETFEDSSAVQKNGGTITGAPTIDFGATLDGTNDYITYSLSGNEFNSAEISIILEFWPDFAHDDNTRHMLFEADTGFYWCDKRDTGNFLRIYLGGTAIANIDPSTYGQYWMVNQRNVLVISGTTGANNVWLNGNQILTNNTTAWTPATPTVLNIGAFTGGTLFSGGKFSSFKIFKSLLTAQDAQNFYNNSTYNYRNQAVLDLPMRAQDHDPTNTRALDVSGNGNHATFGAGTAEPTKNQGRGYSTDGGDNMQTGTNLFTETGEISFSIALKLAPPLTSNQAVASYEKADISDVGFLVLYASSDDSIRFYCGSAASANNAARKVIGDTGGDIMTLTGVHDGTNTKIYVNGVVGIDATTPLAPDVTADMLATFFERANATQSLSSGAEIYEAQLYDIGLSPLQAADAHLTMLKQINQT